MARALILALAAFAQDPKLEADILALRAEKPPWRRIAWKSCLLEGLKESLEQKKPVLLWIFIDRPIDDERG